MKIQRNEGNNHAKVPFCKVFLGNCFILESDIDDSLPDIYLKLSNESKMGCNNSYNLVDCITSYVGAEVNVYPLKTTLNWNFMKEE